MGFNFNECYYINKRGKRVDYPPNKSGDIIARFFSLPKRKRYIIA